MSRDFGNYVTCGILAMLFVMFLPAVPLLIAVIAIVQLLTGRRGYREKRWHHQWQAKPETPASDEPMPEFRASEAIIDAEVVDLPDPKLPEAMENRKP